MRKRQFLMIMKRSDHKARKGVFPRRGLRLLRKKKDRRFSVKIETRKSKRRLKFRWSDIPREPGWSKIRVVQTSPHANTFSPLPSLPLSLSSPRAHIPHTSTERHFISFP